MGYNQFAVGTGTAIHKTASNLVYSYCRSDFLERQPNSQVAPLKQNQPRPTPKTTPNA
jgi:hypothetical protein